jgi:Trk-type K+ transport system membrane component
VYSHFHSYVTHLEHFSCTDWFFFMVLDIGNPAVEVVPLGTRFVIGLLQATAVRAAGFATVTLAALAPAVKCVVRRNVPVAEC